MGENRYADAVSYITFTFKNVAYDIFAFTYKAKKYNLNTGCNNLGSICPAYEIYRGMYVITDHIVVAERSYLCG